jgi:hypothetical protein
MRIENEIASNYKALHSKQLPTRIKKILQNGRKSLLGIHQI